MTIARDLIHRLRPFLKRREFIAILGPRQAGKTTLLNMIEGVFLNEFKFDPSLVKTVTFEDRKLLREFEADPVTFTHSYFPRGLPKTACLMIDEFQYAENGGQKLKFIFDTVKNIKIIVTGSSSLEIKAPVGKYMVGRLLAFMLTPFNFGEFLHARNPRLESIYRENTGALQEFIFLGKMPKQKKVSSDPFAGEMLKHYEEFCVWGGYPAVVLSSRENEKRKVLSEIYNNYVMKDIKGLLALETERSLFLLSRHLAAQIGSLVNYHRLGQAAGLDYRKLMKHIHILKETFIIQEIRPFFKNRRKELVKNPKIYFLDMGFRNNLMENMNGFDTRPDTGALVENSVFVRLKQMTENQRRINFWRTKAGAEVDFTVHKTEESLPVEVKFSGLKAPEISRSFSSYLQSIKPKHGLILTKDLWGTVKKNTSAVLFAPVYYL